MNIVELKDAALYPRDAGLMSYGTGDTEFHTAYMVIGRQGNQAMVVEGTGPDTMSAIEHLVRQVKLVRDWMDVSVHGAFWQQNEAESRKRADELRRALGLPTAPKAAKKDDDGGLS